MGLLDKLTGGSSSSGLDSLNSRLSIYDGNDNALDPNTLESTTDVRAAYIELDGDGQIEVRRTIGGRWSCMSCDDCTHADRVLDVIEEWANR